jgi:Family of unknown function (DUF6510)
MQTSDMMLDGNAVAGALGEIFITEMTNARILCDGCGSVEPIGGEPAFVQAPGVVLRCVNCGDALLVMTSRPGRHVVGLHGTLEIDA